ncbi:MAG: autotransporter domain-containing protein [Bacteroidetes bacterium]|nr:autotransporter domain-containing protein [Bacteroidota bacterium]
MRWITGLFAIAMLASCVTAYKGETIILPTVDSAHKYALQGGFSHLQFQLRLNKTMTAGMQFNFPGGRMFFTDTNRTGKNTFQEVRFFGGYQMPPREGKRSYFFGYGGLGFGNCRYTENYRLPSQSVDSARISFSSGFQNVFIQAGYKASLGGKVWLVPHLGAKVVTFNNAKITRVVQGANDLYSSPIFLKDRQIPMQLAPVISGGCSLLRSGERMDYFLDFTVHNGNYMFQRLTSRFGLGFHF